MRSILNVPGSKKRKDLNTNFRNLVFSNPKLISLNIHIRGQNRILLLENNLLKKELYVTKYKLRIIEKSYGNPLSLLEKIDKKYMNDNKGISEKKSKQFYLTCEGNNKIIRKSKIRNSSL